MQNSQILCRILKHVNSAKHWIATANKTITGQYGSTIVLQQSDQQCVSWCTHCFVWGRGALTVGVWSRKWRMSPCKGCQEGVKISLSAMQSPIRQKRLNFRFPYLDPPNAARCKVPPEVYAPPSALHSRPHWSFILHICTNSCSFLCIITLLWVVFLLVAPSRRALRSFAYLLSPRHHPIRIIFLQQ